MKQQNWAAIGFAAAIALIISTTWYISRTTPDITIETLMFYVIHGNQGAGDQTVLRGIQMAGPLFVAIVGVLAAVSYRPYSGRWPNATLQGLPIERVGSVSLAQAYAVILAILVVATLQYFGTSQYLSSRYLEKTTIYEEHYVHPGDVEISFPDQKRNLIMIYAESIESTVLSRSGGGAWDTSLMPELETLASENVNFSNTNRLGGAVRTDAAISTSTGLVAQTSGTPLTVWGDFNLNNTFIDYDSYLPGLVSLGDILQEQGYKQKFILGSDANFGNRKTYYQQHGEHEIFDYPAAQDSGDIPRDYFEWWGYEDKKLFEFARESASEMAASGQPFALSLLTVDTHFYDGWLDPSCRDFKRKSQYENVHLCSSRMIGGFVDWLRNQDFYENTTVVIVGDHLGMQTEFYTNQIPEGYQRTVYNAYINAPISPSREKNRTMSAFDTFPTTIASIGGEFKGDRLGFGTNLFSESETLAEEIGMDTIDAETRKRSDYYQTCIIDAKNCNKKRLP